jgi:hypothetical protein
MRALLLLSVLSLVACGNSSGEGPTMRPGENCKGCHGSFSIAGTVFPSAQAQASEGLAGVTVTVVDSAQKTLTLTSNSVGNFFSEDALTWPADITLTLGSRTASMQGAASGACAGCHTSSSQNRVYLP